MRGGGAAGRGRSVEGREAEGGRAREPSGTRHKGDPTGL